MKFRYLLCFLFLMILSSCLKSKDDAIINDKKTETKSVSIDSLTNTEILNFVNNSKAEVIVLFDQKKDSKIFIDFGESLFVPIEVCFDGRLFLKIGTIKLKIYKDSIQVVENNTEIFCKNKIKTFDFLTNIKQTLGKDGLYKTSYDTIPKRIKISHSEVVVNSLKDECNDTGKNPFVLKLKSGEIYFNDIDNLQLFEFDLDKNGNNEIYILSFASCMSYLKIYKVIE